MASERGPALPMVLTVAYGVLSAALFVIPIVVIGGPDQYCHATPSLAWALLAVGWGNWVLMLARALTATTDGARNSIRLLWVITSITFLFGVYATYAVFSIPDNWCSD